MYGTADAGKVWADQVPGELNEPVLVGGKDQKLSLPYDPQMLVPCVICGDNDTNPSAGQKRIFAGWSVAFFGSSSSPLFARQIAIRALCSSEVACTEKCASAMKSRWWSDSQSVSAGQCICCCIRQRFHGNMGNSTFCQTGIAD